MNYQTNKQEYLIKEILCKPDYELIRAFVDFMLGKIDSALLEEKSKQYTGIILKHIEEKRKEEEKCKKNCKSAFEEIRSATVLHVAADEGNTNIAKFLLNSVKIHESVLKNLLFAKMYTRDPEEDPYAALGLACLGDHYELVTLLLNFTVDILGEDGLQELLHKSEALHVAISGSNNDKILKELLKRANKNKRLVFPKGEFYGSILNLAYHLERVNYAEIILQEFKNDKKLIKRLLLYDGGFGNALYYAISYCCGVECCEYLLSLAKDFNDNNKTLKQLLLPIKGSEQPFKTAIQGFEIRTVEILLKTAKDIDDDDYILKLLNDKTTVNPITLEKELPTSALEKAVKKGNAYIIKLLLEAIPIINNELFEKIIFNIVKEGNNMVHLNVENGHEDIFIDSLKILEGDKYHNIRRKVIEMHNSMTLMDRLSFEKRTLLEAIQLNKISDVKKILECAKECSIEKFRILLLATGSERNRCNTLNIACWYGNLDLVRLLISYATDMNDEGETLKELLTSRNCRNKTPFEEIKLGCISEIKQNVQNFILQARNDGYESVLTILQENQVYRNVDRSILETQYIYMTL